MIILKTSLYVTRPDKCFCLSCRLVRIQTMRAQSYFLFEWMDSAFVPKSLRLALRDILEVLNCHLRPYNRWVLENIVQETRKNTYLAVVELGAGSAPLTKALSKDPRCEPLKLIPCDLDPDLKAYEKLESLYPEKVQPIKSSVDFSRPHQFGKEALLVLNSTFHHIPYANRKETLRSLLKSGKKVLIFEGVRHNAASVVFVALGFLGSLIAPFFFLNAPERAARVLFWCWLIPAAPFLMVWDGWVSCLRASTTAEWQSLFAELDRPQATIQNGLFTQYVSV